MLSAVDERIITLAERYRQDFRTSSKEYQRLYREYDKLHFYNIIQKIRLLRQIKKAKQDMDFAERKYNLLQPSAN